MKYVKCRTDIQKSDGLVRLGHNHPARTAYWTARINTYSAYLGFFRYPRRDFINDSFIPEAEIDEVIDVLRSADLVDYDAETGFIRLIGWFYEEYAPENRSQVITRSREYLTNRFPRTTITARSIAEFLCGSAMRVSQYDPDSKHGPEVIEELRRFIVPARHKYPDLDEAMFEEVRRQSLAEVPEIKDVSFGFFDYRHCGTVPSPVPHGVTTVQPQERKEEEKKAKEKGNGIRTLGIAKVGPRAETLDSPVAKQALAAHRR